MPQLDYISYEMLGVYFVTLFFLVYILFSFKILPKISIVLKVNNQILEKKRRDIIKINNEKKIVKEFTERLWQENINNEV
jgi:hypothetical protein